MTTAFIGYQHPKNRLTEGRTKEYPVDPICYHSHLLGCPKLDYALVPLKNDLSFWGKRLNTVEAPPMPGHERARTIYIRRTASIPKTKTNVLVVVHDWRHSRFDIVERAILHPAESFPLVTLRETQEQPWTDDRPKPEKLPKQQPKKHQAQRKKTTRRLSKKQHRRQAIIRSEKELEEQKDEVPQDEDKKNEVPEEKYLKQNANPKPNWQYHDWGAVVIDEKTGDLYGHITGDHDRMTTDDYWYNPATLAPIQEVLSDLSRRTNAKVALASSGGLQCTLRPRS
ncbi:hypothetical protein B0T17DRAFT_614654 [Bombardia bombarda]|uniref:Uncharacterized protein n=1 Tax=Bombardia bombarda TaxID=252184 RepID=A0AA39X7J9_9PEZI|nr:hypothetical protein B0T17DRAFT_614654 [Bombardia bombarda]